MTAQSAVAAVKEALIKGLEKHFEILYYRKNGESALYTPLPTSIDYLSCFVYTNHPFGRHRPGKGQCHHPTGTCLDCVVRVVC